MFRGYRILSIVTGMCVLFFMAMPVIAQQGQQQGQPGAAETQQKIKIGDSELEKAAEAYSNILSIHEEFQASIQQTQDANERQQLQNKANKKMVKAVESTGLDVDKYTKIMVQVRSDEKLREQFDQKMEQQVTN
jgi:hypothetical protein